MPEHRSGCPINLATEVLGNKWSLVILRDLMFSDRRYFRELLQHSEEGIASNILADRLQRLVTNGLVWRAPDPTHKQKIRYSLTEPAIQLVPIMAHLGLTQPARADFVRAYLQAAYEAEVAVGPVPTTRAH